MTDKVGFIEGNSQSHLYVNNGLRIEKISGRLIGKVFVQYRTARGWLKKRERWMEVFSNYITFYKYTTKKRHYKVKLFKFSGIKNNYRLGGLESTGKDYRVTITDESKRKGVKIITPNETMVTVLYPYLSDCLELK